MDVFAEQIAQKKGCKLIVISNNIRLSIPGAEIIDNPTVEQFLELILYAKNAREKSITYNATIYK